MIKMREQKKYHPESANSYDFQNRKELARFRLYQTLWSLKDLHIGIQFPKKIPKFQKKPVNSPLHYS